MTGKRKVVGKESGEREKESQGAWARVSKSLQEETGRCQEWEVTECQSI